MTSPLIQKAVDRIHNMGFVNSAEAGQFSMHTDGSTKP